MKIAVCDDEKIIRNQISTLLKQYNNDFIIDEYNNGLNLLKHHNNYDIIFLDIEMPEIDGMSVAEKIRESNLESRLIFLTSHIECVHDAFKVKAFRFLAKPVDLLVFNEAVKEAETEVLNTERIIINQKGRLYDIRLKDIVYLEAFGDGAYIYDRFNNIYESHIQLKEWDSKLSGKHFYKIHKTYIVSMFYVKKIDNNQLQLENIDTPFIIARRNITSFKEAYLQFVKNCSIII